VAAVEAYQRLLLLAVPLFTGCGIIWDTRWKTSIRLKPQRYPFRTKRPRNSHPAIECGLFVWNNTAIDSLPNPDRPNHFALPPGSHEDGEVYKYDLGADIAEILFSAGSLGIMPILSMLSILTGEDDLWLLDKQEAMALREGFQLEHPFGTRMWHAWRWSCRVLMPNGLPQKRIQ